MKIQSSLVFKNQSQNFKFSNGRRASLSGRDVFLKRPLETEESQAHFTNELLVLPLLRGVQNVLNPVAFENGALVYPFIENSLLDLCGQVSPTDITSILLRLLNTLRDLHERSVIHADIKLENIRISPAGDTFLSDFGRAIQVVGHKPNQIGSLSQHHAPDMTLSPAFDLYSIGVLAYQLLFGPHFMRDFALKGRDFLKIPESLNCPDNLLQFIDIATRPDVSERFQSAQEAISFLKNEVKSQHCRIESYDLKMGFEVYLEFMKKTFAASRLPISRFDAFIGDHGKSYHRRLTDWAGRQDAILIHLKLGERIAGILEASVSADDIALISTLFVAEEARGRGFARMLEQHAHDFFKGRGFSKMELNVASENHLAIRYYRSTGWLVNQAAQYSGSLRFSKNLI